MTDDPIAPDDPTAPDEPLPDLPPALTPEQAAAVTRADLERMAVDYSNASRTACDAAFRAVRLLRAGRYAGERPPPAAADPDSADWAVPWPPLPPLSPADLDGLSPAAVARIALAYSDNCQAWRDAADRYRAAAWRYHDLRRRDFALVSLN